MSPTSVDRSQNPGELNDKIKAYEAGQLAAPTAGGRDVTELRK